MFVYTKNGRIIHKSDEKKPLRWYLEGSIVYCVSYNKNDHLILEDGKIKIYETSQQYFDDINGYAIQRENNKLKRENNRLKPIAEREIRNQLRKRSYEKLTDYDIQKYENYFTSK